MEKETRRCPHCNKEFEVKAKCKIQICCSPECYKEYRIVLANIDKKKEIQKIKSTSWRRGKYGWMMKFYEVFGGDYTCDLCGTTLEENMKKYGVPLHMKLETGINDYRVMDPDSWVHMCTKCFVEVKFYTDD